MLPMRQMHFPELSAGDGDAGVSAFPDPGFASPGCAATDCRHRVPGRATASRCHQAPAGTPCKGMKSTGRPPSAHRNSLPAQVLRAQRERQSNQRGSLLRSAYRVLLLEADRFPEEDCGNSLKREGADYGLLNVWQIRPAAAPDGTDDRLMAAPATYGSPIRLTSDAVERAQSHRRRSAWSRQ